MKKVINIRGTSGSGKSTLVRRIMEMYANKEPVHVEGRKQPLYYRLSTEGMPTLSLLGHYETACGGCDTIPSMDRIYELVRERLDAGDHVLYEGLLLSAEFNRVHQLHVDGYNLTVVELETPLDVCVDSVNQRRRAKDPEKEPVNPKNTESKFRQTRSTCKKLEAHGVDVRTLGRDEAFETIRGMLL